MIHTPNVTRVLVISSLATVVPFAAAGQGTSAASNSGVVTDDSGGVLPDGSVEVSGPALIEKVRTATTNEREEYRIVELRPGIWTVTFTRQGFGSFRREGIELTSNFNAAINAELHVGTVEQSVTVSGRRCWSTHKMSRDEWSSRTRFSIPCRQARACSVFCSLTQPR